MRGKVILGMSAISLALVGAVFATAVNDRGAVYSPIKATEPTYTLAATSGVDVTDGTGVIRTALGADINFSFSKYTKQDAYFGDLAKGGYIRNSDIIHSIRSIEIALEGEVEIYHGYFDGYSVIFNESDVATYETGSYTLDLSDRLPTYFKIVATGEGKTSIESFAVSYGCNEQTAASKFTIRVNKPTVGGSGDIRYGNKLWINTDAVSDGWQNYQMIEDGDTYYYTFENVNLGEYRSVGNHYGFSLALSSSSAESPDWNYKFDYDLGDSYFFSVFEGQDELFVGDTFNFASQPIPAADPYTLKMNLEVRGSFGEGALGNIKFVYRQSESEDFNWDTVFGTSPSPTYSASISGLDCTKTLQFKIYIWHKEPSSDSFVTPKNADYFTYVPSMDSNQTLTVTFTFPITGNTTGILTEGEDDNPSTEMSYADQTVNVNIHRNSVKINPVFDGNSQPFSWEYSGENIRIDEEGNIIGLKAGTTTTVTLTSLKGLTCSFDVAVPDSTYEATWTRDWSWNGKDLGEDKTSVLEGWFDEPSKAAVAGFDDNFWNGADISSVKALYDNGSKFFNTDGVEQSLFYILKDHGFNWVRTKIWVDPQTVNGKSYGGGESTLENALWVTKEAKAAGMKVLLDFHYSDYWTHPGQQILPKAWAGASSSDELAKYISDYTKDTLDTFNDNGCLPEMVQLGNEISSGSFLQGPGTDSDVFGAIKYYEEGGEIKADKSDLGKPNYLMGASDLSSSIKGTGANMVKYLKAAANAVNENYPSVEKVIHWAKGRGDVADPSKINTFFAGFSEVDYEYAGISFYPYYCFNTMSQAADILAGLSIDKPWFVAETSYPFSGYSWVYEDDADVASAAINAWTSKLTSISSTYPFTGAGQASMIHDLTAAVVNAGGKGMFYWEPAWVPNKYVGWAGEGSACSWANQGFFSYDGKALNNIKVFDQMKGS